MPTGAWVFVLVLPLLVALQLVPLPSSVWSGLPLRGLLANALHAVDEPLPSWPLSIDPASTWWSLLSLAPPVAAFIMAFTIGREKVPALLLAIAGLAVFSGLLEAAQALLGDFFYIHPRSIEAGPSGLFANQNSQATFLVIGILALATLALFDKKLHRYRPLLVAAAVFLALCVVMTRSRAGTVLLLVPIFYVAAVAFARTPRKRNWLIGSALTAVALPILIIGALQIERINKLAERFSDLSSGRAEEIWPDALYLAQEAWPWGMGVGTFRHSFELVERLEVVDQSTANRAHVDWLEFVIEAGLPGVLLMIAALLAIAWSLWSKRKRIGLNGAFGMGVLLVIALHSSVDYPLRAISLAVLASIAMALILSDGTHLEKRK
ncbi:MAG: O-antigen ligase family protein [Erythrobacter sp.]